MSSIASYLFSLHGPVSRRSYVSRGLGLMGLKYLLDGSVVRVLNHVRRCVEEGCPAQIQ